MPKVNLIPSNVFVANGNLEMPLGDEVTFFINATDNIGLSGLQLLINDETVALSANGTATFIPDELGIISAKASAYDAAGNSGSSEVEIRVFNPNDTAPPVVELSPDIGSEPITAPVDIVGTVTDDNLVNYKLQIAPAAGGEFVTIAQGDSSIFNGNLGLFDPTTLQNDSYILRLEATDSNGQTSSTEQIVEVTGELKLGNFRLSFTDLEIPVAGIPISVTRTYDTLTANSQDDFGYGWRLEFRDTDLRTSVKAPTEQQQLLGIPAAFDDNTRVYVTLPGGKRTAFTFNPYGDRLNSFLGSAGSAGLWYHPAFESDETDVTLSVDDVRLVKGTERKYYDLGGAAYNPENPRFGGSYTLTTKSGIEYKIDAVSGDLLTVNDTNGNTLTYSALPHLRCKIHLKKS